MEIVLNPVVDSFLNEANPGARQDSLSTIQIGFGDTGVGFHGVLKFDLSTIPPGVEILSATLSLYQVSRFNTGLATTARRLLRDWDEQATWQKYDSTHNWAVYGANGALDLAGASAGSFTTGGTNNIWYDMTLSLSEFYEILKDNKGWRLNNVYVPGAYQLCSYSSSEGANPPKLTVVYNEASLGVNIF